MVNFKNFFQWKKEKGKNIDLNESAYKFQDIYKVKSTFEVPSDLVESYIKKVKEDTSQEPLTFWSKSEIAEEIVNYFINHKLRLEEIPVELIIGEEEGMETTTSDEEDSEYVENEFVKPSQQDNNDEEEKDEDDDEKDEDEDDEDDEDKENKKQKVDVIGDDEGKNIKDIVQEVDKEEKESKEKESKEKESKEKESKEKESKEKEKENK